MAVTPRNVESPLVRVDRDRSAMMKGDGQHVGAVGGQYAWFGTNRAVKEKFLSPESASKD